jgi:predicted nucleic acid-binding protein
LEIARLRTALRGVERIALDSCIFIYQWQAHPRYSPLTDFVFSSVEQGDFAAYTSTITMTELLVHPYREREIARVNELLGLFSTYPNLEWIVPHLEIARHAAKIRAQYALKTPDALQAATAIHAKASVLLTNDPAFRRVADFQALILDEFV